MRANQLLAWLFTLGGCLLTAAVDTTEQHGAVRATAVYSSPDAASAVVGRLERGARFDVVALDGGWGFLVLGAVPATALGFDAGEAPVTRYRYGRSRSSRLLLRLAPSADSRIVERLAADRSFAFDADDSLLDAGWLRRRGRFVEASKVEFLTPSAFGGIESPPDAIAFFVGRHGPLPWGAAFEPGQWSARSVSFDGGTLLRSDVRLAQRRPRPAEVPRDASWVHIDLTEQTLTAYASDRLVYATLVSTGSPAWPTRPGLNQVRHKVLHEYMHGEGYFVEEVPFIQYFDRGQALHGAFWHERFGTPVSHGCVNLSMADARWLFDWAPPLMPRGWHALEVEKADLPALWVKVKAEAFSRGPER